MLLLLLQPGNINHFLFSFLSIEHYYELPLLISGVLNCAHVGIIAALFYTKQ
jgi:hypothetical protein